MTEFPRKVEGGHTLEVVPGIFVTHFLSGNDPKNEEAFADGERVGFYHFQKVAEGIGVAAVNGTRAFNDVYANLYSQAAEQGHIPRSLGHYAGLKPEWDYMGSWDNVNKAKRSRILLATQAVYESYGRYMETVKGNVPILNQYKVIEAMLGLDEIRKFDESFIPAAGEDIK